MGARRFCPSSGSATSSPPRSGACLFALTERLARSRAAAAMCGKTGFERARAFGGVPGGAPPLGRCRWDPAAVPAREAAGRQPPTGRHLV